MPPHRSSEQPPPPSDTGSSMPTPGVLPECASVESSIESVQSHLDQASSLVEMGACSALFAHEVNNLMTQVGGRAQLALLYPDRSDLTHKALELALHASNQIAQLAQTLLINESTDPTHSPNPHGSASLESTGSGLESAPQAGAGWASIEQIHQQALAYLSPEAVDAYRFELDDRALARTHFAPAVALGQVFLNLYLNAIRAIEEGDGHPGGLVAIRLLAIEHTDRRADQCSTGNTRRLQIIVEDNGIGMTPCQIKAQIKPQAKDQPASRPGHGYGLKVSQALLAQVGGTLNAQSVKGQGTQMTITLPTSTGPSSLAA